MRGTGITNARWQILSELSAFEKRVTVSELARHMGLTRQAVQRIADDMANDGLVEFAENPGDARAMHLLITEAGKATLRKRARQRMMKRWSANGSGQMRLPKILMWNNSLVPWRS